jgi:hypothetical protein
VKEKFRINHGLIKKDVFGVLDNMNYTICEICKKMFIKTKTNLVYCSKKCANKGEKKQLKKYRIKNWEKIKQRQNKYRKNRRNNDVNFKITCCLRWKIWDALKGNSKSFSIIELLGCSIKQLKKHLESQFKPNMTWDNWGRGDKGKGMKEWHIDHIKPCSKFDLSNPEEQKKCFNYKNLQPLWARKNIIKSNKYCNQ